MRTKLKLTLAILFTICAPLFGATTYLAQAPKTNTLGANDVVLVGSGNYTWGMNQLVFSNYLYEVFGFANTTETADLISAYGNILNQAIGWQADTNVLQWQAIQANRNTAVPLSIPQAKMPDTNFAVLSGGWQNWELSFYKTNGSGSIYTNSAVWQTVVPPDYTTNSLSVRLLSIINATNGPNSSNSIFRASVLVVAPGSATDVHLGAFGSTASGTNTWAASATGTNQIQSLSIPITCTAKAGDLLLLRLDRDAVADTVNGTVSLVGASLEYTR